MTTTFGRTAAFAMPTELKATMAQAAARQLESALSAHVRSFTAPGLDGFLVLSLLVSTDFFLNNHRLAR